MTSNQHSGNLCPNWIFSNNSNVHVARDREWFSDDYVCIESKVSGLLSGDMGVRVVGIGTVILLTKKNPHLSGSSNYGTLVLENVLHVPEFLCNVLGGPILKTHIVDMRERSIRDASNNTVKASLVLSPCKGLLELKLRGQAVGPATIEPGVDYMIHALWTRAEMDRCLQAINRSQESAPLTGEEKDWLKKNHKDEFHFLRDFGLSIYKEEDRSEGREILRSLMAQDSELEDPELDDEDDDAVSDAGSFMRDLESDPSSHLADYKFTEAELEWIKEGYGHSGNFMRCFMLKPWEDHDIDEAKIILKAMMTGD